MDRPLAIDFVLEKLRIFASVRPGILVEEKTLCAGLHFCLAPLYESACLSFCMQLADETGLYLQRGIMLFELRPGARSMTMMSADSSAACSHSTWRQKSGSSATG